ncbi:MAG: 30S ribosome-binding factor RbfA [bacterium]
MPKDFSRTLRLGEQIRRELAQLLTREVKDPRVGMVTLSDVEVSSDLAHAKVFYTVLGDDVDREKTQQGLEKASGFLRHKVGQAIKTRITPELHFRYDDTSERGADLEALIEQALYKQSKGKPD